MAQRRFTFVGVTTGQSAIMRIFPEWARYLRLEDVQIVGCDLPIHAPEEQYRHVVRQMKADPLDLGGLVTTHKIDLYEACRDLFDYLDPYALLCGEVSCLSKRDGRFEGHAKDPISAGQSLDLILRPGHWGETGGHVLCLGAGGSAIAITLHLMTRPAAADRPRRIVVVSRTQSRLDAMRAIHATIDADTEVDYVLSSEPEANDRLMAQLPPGSMVINATGMGKDIPGSPITDAGLFPERGIAWELNYRGALDFLHQANRQRERRGLAVHDGWDYFIFGWTAVIDQVFHLRIDEAQFAAMSEIARRIVGR